ncbi:MAG: peptidylprolyl isomerase [Woeseia sp.]
MEASCPLPRFAARAGSRSDHGSQAQIRACFRDNARFSADMEGKTLMAKASARHILVDTEEQAQELKDQIEGGADFAVLAKEHSSCPSGQKGGELGEFGPGMMVREFDEVVFSADVNKVQGPVKTQFGFHLLEVTDRSD